MVIEYACELVEQIITPGCEITLIEVVANDEFLKGHFGEVGGKRAVTPDARDTDRQRRYGVEPVECREAFGDLEGGEAESAFAEATDKVGVVAVSDRQTRPPAQAQCLNLVGGIITGYKLESVTELRVGKLVPAQRHGEVDM